MLEYEGYHIHTCYSNALTQPDSTMFIKDYAKAYRERGHRVLCISEHGNRSNVWEQFDICEEYKNDKDNPYVMTPIAAAEAYFVPDRLKEVDGKKDGRNFHLILVAKDMEGFYELNEALSEANLTGFYSKARVDFDILSKLDYKHFICTTACVAGILKDESCEQLACQLHEIFRENFYLEVQHHPQRIQAETNLKALRLYKKYNWPLIYGTDSHYINKEDKILRTELMKSANISYGDEDSFDLHLPTAAEAFKLFQTQGVLSKAQIEEAMENTLVLRDFEGVHFTKEKKIPNVYPDIPIEKRNFMYKKMVCDEYIKKAGMPNKEEAAEIHAEMDTITSTNTADYFLTLKKILDHGIELGGVVTKTGRGSCASFASNYCLNFSNINRLHCPVKLYPFRFISADRLINGLPDVDVNLSNRPAFERAGKDILGEYGCLPMVAYGTAKTLSAFKLLARARDLDFETSNEVSKQIQNYEADVKHAKENNSDDPEYNVDDDVPIENYIDDKYLNLIEESKQYKGIIVSLSPHPCGYILLDRDIRREIGIVRVKSKSGNKEAVYAAYIDGRAMDAQNYVKMDMLLVDVVRIIAETYKRAGLPIMSVDELLSAVSSDDDVWNLYANGITQGLNQCEQPKSTERVKQYKPKNVCELTAFIAGIRPGFRSMLPTLIGRQHFSYNIPALDNLLKTKEIPESFLLYDEQILTVLQAAGIPGPDAYACTKAIKKKKADKVASYKERFKDGFSKYLKETEGASEEKAREVVEQIWTIIENAANYMFCAAHAFSMACDSLYVAWLKVHYPYELYATMLKLYDEKKNKDKISAIITEMKRYKGIKLLPGRFGQDNRDWLVDKEHATISQSISSIRYISKEAAEALYQIGLNDEAVMGTVYKPAVLKDSVKKDIATIKKKLKQLKERYDKEAQPDMSEEELYRFTEEKEKIAQAGVEMEQLLREVELSPDSYESLAEEIDVTAKLDCFTNVLRAIQMNANVNTRMIEVLIEIGYFSRYGKTGKLMKVFNEFFEGKQKLTKTIKSFQERLEYMRNYEASLPDEDLPIGLRLQKEFDNIGLCLTAYPSAPSNLYFVESVDDKYSVRAKLYSVQRGTIGTIRITKKQQETMPLKEGNLIVMEKYNMRQRCSYKDGKRIPIPGEKDCWVTNYSIMYENSAA